MLQRRQLPLSALRAFESAARHLHMGRAGDDLGVTYSAISHHVRTLESLLNASLFVRAGRRLRLTSAGELLYVAVRDGLDRMVEGTMHLNPDSMAGALTIGCTQTMAISWAIQQIGEFHSKYPQIDVHLIELAPNQKKIPPDIDIALCYGKPNRDERRVDLLCTPLLFPVCSPRLLHGLPPIKKAADVARLPLLHDQQNSWRHWFTQMDADQPKEPSQMFFPNTALCLSAARAGIGVALLNTFEIQEDLRNGTLRRLLQRATTEAHNYYLVTGSAERQSLRARLFEDWIRHAVDRYGQASTELSVG